MASLVMTGAGDNSTTTVDLDNSTTFPNSQTWYKPGDNLTGNITTNDAAHRTAGSFTISAPSNIMWTPSSTGYLVNNALVKKTLVYAGTAIGIGPASGTDSTCIYSNTNGATIVLTFPVDAAGVTTVNIFAGAFLSGTYTLLAHVSDGSSSDVTQSATGGDNPNNWVITCQANGPATLTITLTCGSTGYMYFSAAALSTSVASASPPIYEAAPVPARSSAPAGRWRGFGDALPSSAAVALGPIVQAREEVRRGQLYPWQQENALPAYEVPPPSVAAHVVDVHQNADPSTSTSGSSIAVTRFIQPGNAIHVYVTWDNTTGASASCSDNVNGSYGSALDAVTVGTQNMSDFSFVGAAGGLTTVTASFTAACVLKAIWIQEIAGVSALQVHTGQSQSAPGTGTDAVTSGPMTPTSAPALVVGLASTGDGGQIVSGTGFVSGPTWWGVIKTARSESERVTTTAAVSATFTASVGTGAHRTLAAVYTEARIGGGAIAPVDPVPGRAPLFRQHVSLGDVALPAQSFGSPAVVADSTRALTRSVTLSFETQVPSQDFVTRGTGVPDSALPDRPARAVQTRASADIQVPSQDFVTRGTGILDPTPPGRAVLFRALSVDGPIPSPRFAAAGSGLPEASPPPRPAPLVARAVTDQIVTSLLGPALYADATAARPFRQLVVDGPIPSNLFAAAGSGLPDASPPPRPAPPHLAFDGPIPWQQFVAAGTGLVDAPAPARPPNPVHAAADHLLATILFGPVLANDPPARAAAWFRLAGAEGQIPAVAVVASGSGLFESPGPVRPPMRVSRAVTDQVLAAQVLFFASKIASSEPSRQLGRFFNIQDQSVLGPLIAAAPSPPIQADVPWKRAVQPSLAVDASLPEIFGVAAGSGLPAVEQVVRAMSAARQAASDQVLAALFGPAIADDPLRASAFRRAVPDAQVLAAMVAVASGLPDPGVLARTGRDRRPSWLADAALPPPALFPAVPEAYAARAAERRRQVLHAAEISASLVFPLALDGTVAVRPLARLPQDSEAPIPPLPKPGLPLLSQETFRPRPTRRVILIEDFARLFVPVPARPIPKPVSVDYGTIIRVDGTVAIDETLGVATQEFCGRLSVNRRRNDPFPIPVRAAVSAIYAQWKGGVELALHVTTNDGVQVFGVSGLFVLKDTAATAISVSGNGEIELLVLGPF